MKTTGKKISKKIMITLGAVLVIFISLQFTGPVVSNPPVTGRFAGPDSVVTILERACYDCHSNETKLEWYDKLAPISWKVASHVEEARSRLNFSNWDSLSASDQVTKLWYIVNMVDQGKMPLASYTAVHPSAKVSPGEVDLLKRYVVSLSTPKPAKLQKPGSSKFQAKTSAPEFPLPASPNGIKYFDDYKNWKVITTSNRFDNGTMRVIYGNDIAVKAIRENRINPWPDGAKIAKVVWNKQTEDKDGNVFAGEFSNVQFMLRDAKKYKETGGWGYARFSTTQLKPYGKTATFGRECSNCHQLAKDRGFVFDIPVAE